MAKQIIWTSQAKIDRYDILNYYFSHGTPKQSLKKINSRITGIIKHLAQFPSLGKTFQGEEKIIYKDNYSIIYRNQDEKILILQIWDTRRNPEDFRNG